MQVLKPHFFICFSLFSSVFLLPGCEKLRPSRTAPQVVYTVESGDSVSQIADRYGVSTSEILKENKLRDSSRVYPGQKLHLPPSYLSKLPNGVSRERLEEMLGGARSRVGELRWPLPSRGKINSNFGKRWSSFHEGVDLKGEVGTPIFSAHSGEVVYSGRKMNGYGNMVVVKSGNFLTAYAHNRKNYVRVGEVVEAGQKIAELGMTGRVTGPHLHFETRVKNSAGKYVAVNPLLFFAS